MKIIVNPHKLEIAKEPVNEREIDITKCEFEFADEITNDYVKEAYFTFDGTTYKQIIVNNECSIPYEVLEKKGQVEIGVVAFKTEGAEEIKRYNPSPAYFNTWVGSLKDEYENTEPITPTDKEQIESAIASIQAEQVTQNENISQNTSNITSLSEGKQDKLISGQNIKTINNESLLGAGNLEVITDLSDYYTKEQTDDLLDDKADRSEIPDVSEFITKDVDNLTNYTKTNDMNTAINTAVGNERTSRESSDVALQNQIDAITASSDVVDVVSTYQELSDYDTSSLTEDDIIKVMQDETHSNAISYFRWQLSTWVYIGSEGPFYTKGETDTLLNNKANVSDLPDLTNYVKNTDYATSSKGGVITIANGYATGMTNDGKLYALSRQYSTYQSGNDGMFISKGTLENVITGKQLVNQSTLETSQAEQDDTIEGLQAELERYKLLENALPHTENETPSDYVTLENTAKSPMEIDPIPQTSQETTTGKNLANINIIGRVPSVSNGQLVPLANGATTDLIMIDNTKNYTLSYVLETTGTCFVFFYDENESYLGNNDNIQSGYNLTSSQYFSNSKYLRLRFGSYANFSNIQLEEGSTATSYEPYTGGIPAPNPDYPQEIHRTTGDNQVKVVGKNLLYINRNLGSPSSTSFGNTEKRTFDISTYIKGLTSNNYYYSDRVVVNSISNDSITFTATSGGYGVAFPTILKVGAQYTFSTNISSISNVILRVSFYKEDGTFISQEATATTQTELSFVVPNDTYYTLVLLTPASNVQTTFSNIQLEQSSSATPYTPYEETTYPLSLGNKEMFNINGVYDGFVYDETEDKFYINRNIGKVVLNGSENWDSLVSYDHNGYYCDVNGILVSDNNTNPALLLSNYFKGYSVNDLFQYNLSNNGIVRRTNQTQIIVRNDNVNSLNDFKIWLSSHNTTINYIMGTTILEEITDTTLISQLRAIKNALSMQGMTHVISTSSGTNLPFLIKARAVQNIVNS